MKVAIYKCQYCKKNIYEKFDSKSTIPASTTHTCYKEGKFITYGICTLIGYKEEKL